MLTTILAIFIIYKIIKNKKEKNLDAYIKAEKEVEIAKERFMQLDKNARKIAYDYDEAMIRAEILRSKIV